MNYRATAPCLLIWIFFCSCAIGQATEAPLAVRALVEHADPRVDVEYCGSVSSSRAAYYLFLLQQKELAGVVLVRQRAGAAPAIVDADTSLFPFHEETEPSLEKPVRNAIKLLLQKRNLAKMPRAPERTANLDSEVSAVGREIDRVIYPISGFRFGSNSTHEILRLLRTGPATAVNPRNAPPGSIIVSPTQSSPYGPVYLGHAGIVGLDDSIYSADARYAGARTKNFSLTSWCRRFSGTNGSYAFVLRARSGGKVRAL